MHVKKNLQQFKTQEKNMKKKAFIATVLNHVGIPDAFVFWGKEAPWSFMTSHGISWKLVMKTCELL